MSCLKLILRITLLRYLHLLLLFFFFNFKIPHFVNFKIPQYFYETLSVGYINFSRPRHYCQSVGQMDRMRLINEQNAMSVAKQANNIWFYLFASILSQYVSNLLNSRNKRFFSFLLLLSVSNTPKSLPKKKIGWPLWLACPTISLMRCFIKCGLDPRCYDAPNKNDRVLDVISNL